MFCIRPVPCEKFHPWESSEKLGNAFPHNVRFLGVSASGLHNYLSDILRLSFQCLSLGKKEYHFGIRPGVVAKPDKQSAAFRIGLDPYEGNGLVPESPAVCQFQSLPKIGKGYPKEQDAVSGTYLWHIQFFKGFEA